MKLALGRLAIEHLTPGLIDNLGENQAAMDRTLLQLTWLILLSDDETMLRLAAGDYDKTGGILTMDKELYEFDYLQTK